MRVKVIDLRHCLQSQDWVWDEEEKEINSKYDKYQSPLAERYASEEMSYNFSDQLKYSTWRKLWIVLAETQRTLGIKAITRKQIDEIDKNSVDKDKTLMRQGSMKSG